MQGCGPRQLAQLIWLSRGLRQLSITLCVAYLLVGRGICISQPPHPAVSILVAPLFITSAEFASVVTINNLAASPVAVTATFKALEGEAVAAKEFELGAHSSATLNVDNVKMVEHRFSTLGSVALSATDGVSKIAASVEIRSRDVDESVSILEKFEIVKPDSSPTKTAFVSAGMSIPLLALHNEDDLPQAISIDCSEGYARTYQSQLVLPAGMTFLVNACITGRSESRSYKEILQGDGGSGKGALVIRVTTDGAGDGIAVWGFSSAKAGTALRVASIEFSNATPADRPGAKP
jgi:hypothetical protein